ncbi:Enhancer of mRNA-decapping protein 3 [Acipenser ruthenus]|uniref:Enhancer of mRNA-decapping protein 3 n=1 Tax=Acipenser ruthenus TaxID=7906 RepID=A0A444V0L4_ACIRT|nr:Enhancer of mRNA-decapping protein 3 [Acipenser ruthenus]
MAADWLGSLVSINCGETLGVYQGKVSSVDQGSQTISLRQPFHNGMKCPVPEVTFSAMDIKELKILEIPGGGAPAGQTDAGSTAHNGRSTKGPGSAPMAVPRKGELRAQEELLSPQQCSKSYGDRHLEALGLAKGFRRRHNSWSSSSRGNNQTTPKKNGMKNGGGLKNKDDECFGDPLEEILDTDFDFEGNLALFDKAAVFSEIETSEKRSGARSRGTPSERTPARYRHDENILEAEPIVYRQIMVPQSGGKEYCTGE